MSQDSNDLDLTLEYIIAGAVIENGGMFKVSADSWQSPLLRDSKRLQIEVADNDDLIITLESEEEDDD